MNIQKHKKKILIIGDSICLSRTKPEKVELFDTWPNLLNKKNEFELIQLAIGGGTIGTLNEQAHYYEACCPDIVIIQSGIVDCVPRALGWLEKEVINSSRFLSFLSNRFIPINFMRKYRKLTYTSKKNYEKTIKEFTKRFSNSKIIFIGILPATKEYEKMIPGISKNINEYNKIIEKQITKDFFYINTVNIPIDGFMSDHHHLNSIGHRWLAEVILSSIKEKL